CNPMILPSWPCGWSVSNPERTRSTHGFRANSGSLDSIGDITIVFGLFRPAPFSDPQLGEFRRSRGLWRGVVLLAGRTVPLAVSGSRAAPDPQALDIARAITSSYVGWRPVIERALFEHYSPYADAIAAGESELSQDALPRIDEPSAVWPHTHAEFVQVTRL